MKSLLVKETRKKVGREEKPCSCSLCVDYKQSIYKRGKTSGLFCMDRYFKTTHFLYSRHEYK